jgi:D-glycero-D-manno-heptose 1,7-bisphosphate phosphatase
MPDKAIFLDRDDTLIEDPGYINDPDQVKLLDGVPEALIELKSLGYKLIVVSNQSAVARGIVSEKALGEIHDRIRQVLAERGAYLDQIYYCPYHPEGVVAKYRKESDWRKPNPGMLLAAAKEMDIDLSQSWMLGNSDRDIEAGSRAGCRTILIDRSLHYEPPRPGSPRPDYKAVNLKEATNIVKKHSRSSSKLEIQADASDRDQSQAILETEASSHASERSEMEIARTGPESAASEQASPNDTTEQLLNNVLEQLRAMKRTEMFTEFSVTRLIAGIAQIIVLFCLLIAVWFLMSPTSRSNAVSVALGFAIVFQLMSLTFYTMQGRK